jgi:hypothetical protein
MSWRTDHRDRSRGRDVRGESIAQCGYLCREERPDGVNRELLDFLTDWNG